MILFCGDRSPWGYAHLLHLLKEPRLQLAAVVLPTEMRWRIFQQTMSGEDYPAKRLIPIVQHLCMRLMNRSPLVHRRNILNRLASYQIPVVWCDDINTDQSEHAILFYQAKVFLSAAYPQIFSTRLISLAPKGAFNSHPSLLPRCRGAHPVFWAIASGEKESGATIHYLTEKIDRGDIVAQIRVDLLPEDTRTQLYNRLTSKVPNLLSEFAVFLESPDGKAIPQNQTGTIASYFRNDRKIHHRIFWSEMSAIQIHNLVRACEGTAYCWHGSKRFVILKTEVSHSNRNMTNGVVVPPGTVVDVQHGFPVVRSRDGFIKILKFQSHRFQRFHFSTGQVLL
jgi:methionyl-tRNA formyltransferase